METIPHIEYVGFTTRGAAREYTLRVRRPSGDSLFVLSIPTEAFLARRVRYQDAAEICFLRLQRDLPGLDQDQPTTSLSITDDDLDAYRTAHSPKTPERRPKPPQVKIA
jgi:hypothetical protein